MIEKNLGNVERIIRLLAGVGMLVWAFLQPTMNGIDWFVVIVSAMLILNGIFCRCYLWWVLDVGECRTSNHCDIS